MSYEKQTWQTGDIVTSEKLNHIEDGIGSDLFIVNFSDGENSAKVADKTTDEILAAMNAGKLAVGRYHFAMSAEMVMADECAFIKFFTGTFSVAFNNVTYYTQSGTSWAKMT